MQTGQEGRKVQASKKRYSGFLRFHALLTTLRLPVPPCRKPAQPATRKFTGYKLRGKQKPWEHCWTQGLKKEKYVVRS